MLSRYHRNAVLTGYIDAYCLVCESHLRSEDDIDSHIAKPIHTKNLDSAGYFDKYKDDCIRKVKKGYYCEFCNLLFSTAAKMGLHIAEEKHLNNRGTHFIQRIGDYIIAFKNVLIDEYAWNGLVEDTCAVCNTEFDDPDIHKTESTHILNLVQTKIELGAGNSIYRKIDESSFHCLTCNEVLAINTINTHNEDAEHKEVYQMSQEDYADYTDLMGTDQSVDKKKNTPEPPKVDANKPAALDTKNKEMPSTSAKNPDAIKPDAKKPDTIKPDAKNPDIIKPDASKPDTTKPDANKPNNNTKPDTIKAATTKPDTIKPDNSKPKQEPVKKPTTPIEMQKKVEIPTKTEMPKLDKFTDDLDEAICKALNAKDYIADEHEQGQKWCLICDWSMDPITVHSHLNGKHHQTMLRMHKERLQKKKMAPISSEPEPVKEITPTEQENKEKIVNVLSRHQFYEFNINFDQKSIICNKCSKSVEFDHKIVEQHIEDHKKAAPKKEPAKENNQKAETSKKEDGIKKPLLPKTDDAKKVHAVKDDKESRASSAASNRDNEEEVEKLAKANDLVYNRGDTKVYCRVCDSRVPSSLKNMREHIAGLSHKNKTVKWSEHKQSTKNIVTKKTTADFLRNVTVVQNDVVTDVVINERYCVNVFSFFMITCVDRLRCEACEINLTLEQLEGHKSMPSHERAMRETKVITSHESEFLREVRPQTYHCGFCNVAFPTEKLTSHLATTSHREAKTSSNWRLQQHLPEIIQDQRDKQFGALLLLKMLSESIF